MNGHVKMLNRLTPVPAEIVLCGLQMMLGVAHRFQGFVDVRMRIGCRCRNCSGSDSRSGYGRDDRRGRSLRSSGYRREGERKEKCCRHEQSQPHCPEQPATPAQYSR